MNVVFKSHLLTKTLQSRRRHTTLLRCLGAFRHYHTEHGVFGYKPFSDGAAVSAESESETSSSLDETVLSNRATYSNVYRLISAYRDHGHKIATLDPLKREKKSRSIPELSATQHGLSEESGDTYLLQGLLNVDKSTASLSQIIQTLQDIYCGPLAVEFNHLPEQVEREWFAERYEQIQQHSITTAEKVALAKDMLKSQAFDTYVAAKFASVKRYGGEGAESAMGFFDELFRLAAPSHIQDVVVATAHRGRLNMMACLLKYPPVVMFRKMKGKREFPPDVIGTGDVLSHLTSSVDLHYGDHQVHVTMVPNPSHLEAVNPVAAGKARARQRSLGVGDYGPEDQPGKPGDGVLCLQIHGDAAFTGQGIIAETFAMSNLSHYTVGGTVHFIMNNQIGFTTEPERGRSSQHCSDVAKMVDCPVIHVNGDHPEEVLKACHLALEYRNRFRKDVLVDYMCFRRWGHNEMDEPAFTQPLMYNIIRNRPSIPDAYADKLVEEGICSREELQESVRSWNAELSDHFNMIESHVPKANHLEKQWSGYVQPAPQISTWDTGLPSEILQFVGAAAVTLPDDMIVHPTLVKGHINKRLDMMKQGHGVDWAAAEAMAMGSLLLQGFDVRISGQDVGRGTFSHRHAMLVDQNTDAATVPLNHMLPDQKGFLEVCNSPLSEEAVLGFEYGVSVESPKVLVIWEAQFGDFFNGAQIIIDTFISGGESKWLLQSGLVMLLPHGLDGAGPEHSSSHIERFLQVCDSKEDSIDGDDVNIQVVNPTTPAQYYHVLRRQMVRNFRKPLIVIAPKIMLRSPEMVSALPDMAPGTHFSPVLADLSASAASVTRIVFVSGKHYFTLNKERAASDIKNMAVIRLESLCPFPAAEIQAEISKYPNAKDFIWGQEEHRNQGAWNFIAPRFENVVGKKLRYVGRDVHCAPAAGVAEVHRQEEKSILEATFAIK